MSRINLLNPLFQFYDSPIKRGVLTTSRVLLTSFNSMIVRLKVLALLMSLPRMAGFNSMIVRLKEFFLKKYKNPL